MPVLELTDDELAAVIAALKEKLDRDRYPRATRLKPFRAALAKLDPKSTPRAGRGLDDTLAAHPVPGYTPEKRKTR
jgi:hypothetical protein